MATPSPKVVRFLAVVEIVLPECTPEDGVLDEAQERLDAYREAGAEMARALGVTVFRVRAKDPALDTMNFATGTSVDWGM